MSSGGSAAHEAGVPNSSDPGWKYGKLIRKEDPSQIRCNLCGRKTTGGIFRFKHHLAQVSGSIAPCQNSTPEIIEEITKYLERYGGKRNWRTYQRTSVQPRECLETIDEDPEVDERAEIRKKLRKDGPLKERGKANIDDVAKRKGKTIVQEEDAKEKLDTLVARFFYQARISLSAIHLPSFNDLCDALRQSDQLYMPPSQHELAVRLRRKELKRAKEALNEYRKAWAYYGCSLMLDYDSNARNTNILIKCPEGTILLKSTQKHFDMDDISNLIDKVTGEVGRDNLVQVIFNEGSQLYHALEEESGPVIWTYCAARVLDSMLYGISSFVKWRPWVNEEKRVYKEGRFLASFICRCTLFAHRRTLTRLGMTSEVTYFWTLQNLYNHRRALQGFFMSDEWVQNKWAEKPEGIRAVDMVMALEFWKRVSCYLKFAEPIIRVLELVYSDEKAAMPFIYSEMEQAIEKIKESFKNDEDYHRILDIIDEASKHCNTDLYRMGYILHPANFDAAQNLAVELSSFKCVKRMVPDAATECKINFQWDMYTHGRGCFGQNSAIRGRRTEQPLDWWASHGSNAPELRRIAVRILGLTCRASDCGERAPLQWSKSSCVVPRRSVKKRSKDIAFIRYNQLRQERFLEYKERPGAYNSLCRREWLVGLSTPEVENHERELKLTEYIEDSQEENLSSSLGESSSASSASTCGTCSKGQPKNMDDNSDEDEG